MTDDRHPRPLDRVAVALDTSDWDTFQAWCETFGPRVGVLKIGLEAYLRWGRRAVDTGLEHGRAIFLDLKLHDIPNTVAGAVRAVADSGVTYLTIHSSGGPAMLGAAAESAAGAGGSLRLLAVTLLTHLDRAALDALDLAGPSEERAERWSRLARRAGCAGAVCSPLEVARLRAANPEPFELVTPGVRFGGAGDDDQRRVATPEAAVADGADLLVIGRPLTRAEDPGAALAELERRLSA